MKNNIINSLLLVMALLLTASCDKDECSDKVNPSSVQKADSFLDVRDGYEYKTVRIGNQLWFAENLRYKLEGGITEGASTYGEKYFLPDKILPTDNDFAEIMKKVANDPKYKWKSSFKRRVGVQFPARLIAGAMSITQVISALKTMPEGPEFEKAMEPDVQLAKKKALALEVVKSFNNAEKNNGGYYNEYGLLYSLEGAKKAVPEGWRIPTDEDWKKMEMAVGMSQTSADEIEKWRGEGIGTFLLQNKDGSFSAQTAGATVFASSDFNKYVRRGEYGYYWSSTLIDKNDSIQIALIRTLSLFHDKVWRGTTELGNNNTVRYSVRCVKDL